jgi:hypothetical protein
MRGPTPGRLVTAAKSGKRTDGRMLAGAIGPADRPVSRFYITRSARLTNEARGGG